MDKIFSWMDKGGKFSHILMIVVGGYLYYSIYKMITNMSESQSNKAVVYAAIVLFAVIGTGMILVGGIALATGHYRENQGTFTGENDDEEDEEENDQ